MSLQATQTTSQYLNLHQKSINPLKKRMNLQSAGINSGGGSSKSRSGQDNLKPRYEGATPN